MNIKKTRILFVITKSNFGGAQRYVFDLATNLPKSEYDVAVAFGGEGYLKTLLEKSGVKCFQIKNFERDINLAKEVRAMSELWNIIEGFDPHVLHLNSSKAGGSGAFVGRLLGVPRIVFTAHGWPFYEQRNIVWRILAWFFSYLTTLFAHAVIVVSKHDYDKHMMPFASHKLFHIPVAVPPIDFLDRSSARNALFSTTLQETHKDAIWAVTISEFHHNKNLLRLLEALALHKKAGGQKIFLTLLSDGEERGAIESYITRNDLTEDVVLLGFVENARAYLKAFDVFLIPSIKEGLPYVLLEAGLAGLYCIGSNVGGIPDIIEQDITGAFIDPKNIQSIADALAHIPHNKSEIGCNLQSYVENHFALAHMMQATMKVYSKTIR